MTPANRLASTCDSIGHMHRIGTVAELWRYPVKSMRGESLAEAELDPAGLVGDRRFAFASTAAPAGKPMLSSQERSAMLRYAPRLDPLPEIVTPQGRRLALPSPALVTELQQALAAGDATLTMRRSPERPLTDVRPVSLVSTATLRRLNEEFGRSIDTQRFRSNLVLALDAEQPFGEDALAGALLHFGEADGPQLRVLERIPRCRMVSLDPETTDADPDLLRHLARWHDGRLGIYASVHRPGRLRTGEALFAAR